MLENSVWDINIPFFKKNVSIFGFFISTYSEKYKTPLVYFQHLSILDIGEGSE